MERRIGSIRESFSIDMLSGAYVTLDSSWKSVDVCDTFSRLYFIKSGQGHIHHNGEVIFLCPGNAYLIPSGCTISYDCIELEKIYFHLYAYNAKKIDILSGITKICSIPFTEEQYEDLYERCFSEHYAMLIKIKSIIYDIVSIFVTNYTENHFIIEEYSDTVTKIMKYIRSNKNINLDLQEIANATFFSVSGIRKIFKNEVGVPIKKYIESVVFSEAKKLLAQKSMSISEISSLLGFYDRYYFSKRFKHIYGITPNEYKRRF